MQNNTCLPTASPPARKKGILFLNTSPALSGAEVSLLALLKSLDKAKYRPIVATPPDTRFYNELRSSAEVIPVSLPRMKKTRSPIKWIRSLLSVVKAGFILRRIMKKNDIDILYANGTQAAIYGLAPKMTTGKKLVWHVRDNIRNKILARLLGTFSDRIVFSSAWLAGQLKSFRTRKAILHNFVLPVETASLPRNRIRPALSLPPDTFLIGHVGQLIPWKNHRDAILALECLCRDHENIHLAIIGDDRFGEYGTYRQQLDGLIRSKALDRKISFLGWREDIFSCLQEIDLLWHTALHEPFGRVIVEAMSARKPVVCYDGAGPAELVCHRITGYLVDPGKGYCGLAERTAELITDKDRRQQMGSAAAAHVAHSFARDVRISEYELLLDAL